MIPGRASQNAPTLFRIPIMAAIILTLAAGVWFLGFRVSTDYMIPAGMLTLAAFLLFWKGRS